MCAFAFTPAPVVAELGNVGDRNAEPAELQKTVVTNFSVLRFARCCKQITRTSTFRENPGTERTKQRILIMFRKFSATTVPAMIGGVRRSFDMRFDFHGIRPRRRRGGGGFSRGSASSFSNRGSYKYNVNRANAFSKTTNNNVFSKNFNKNKGNNKNKHKHHHGYGYWGDSDGGDVEDGTSRMGDVEDADVEDADVEDGTDAEPVATVMPITLLNPAEIGQPVKYTLGSADYSVDSAGRKVHKEGTQVIVFDRGGEFGDATYTLQRGTYRFIRTDRGLDLRTVTQVASSDQVSADSVVNPE